MGGHYIGSSAKGCAWDEIDDLAHQLDKICGLRPSNPFVGGNKMSTCSTTCAMATRQFTIDCKPTLDKVFQGDSRENAIVAFEKKCYNSVDSKAILKAIMNAKCPDSNKKKHDALEDKVHKQGKKSQI